MENTLVFDGHSISTPCFYDASKLNPPDPDPSTIPDSNLLPPPTDSQSDYLYMQRLFQLAPNLHAAPPPPPDACKINPPGFVCGPLPALPGQVVTCVPRIDHSDLKQLAARVLPLTASRGHGDMDDPSTADPRFSLFPNQYPSAFSRCCGGGNLSVPTSTKPLQCVTAPPLKDRLIPNEKQSIVNPKELGFRTNLRQLAQLKLTHDALNEKTKRIEPFMNARDALWSNESRRLLSISGMTNPVAVLISGNYLGDFI